MNDSNKTQFSVYELNRQKDDTENTNTEIGNQKDGFRISCQVILSNQSRLLLSMNKPLNRGIVDFRTLILLAFIKYLKKLPLEFFRSKIESLNSFDSILKSFEDNLQYLRKLKNIPFFSSEIWASQASYFADLSQKFNGALRNLMPMHDYGDKKIRLSSCLSSLDLSLKFCQSTAYNGARYFRIRPNRQTYTMTSKKLDLDFHILQTEEPSVAIYLFNHQEFVH